MSKALVLLSGGLDSMLAARVLMEQGIEVTGLCFVSNFFNAVKAKKAADILGIRLIEIDFSEAHLEMVKNPAHGYGKNANPCIDCHGMMFEYASTYLKYNPPNPLLERGKERVGEYDFIATGEVLGQRPMSQNKQALKTVEKIAGLENKILRPLSAKLLEETEIEKEGLVNREKLLDINGRTRERQTELARAYNIKDFPSPAGGCLLTDPDFGERIFTLLKHWPDCSSDDVRLLKNGRIFWVKNTVIATSRGLGTHDDKISYALIVIGRNKEDNENLITLAKNGDVVVELKDEVGPLTIVRIFNFSAQGGPALGWQFSIFNEGEIELDIPGELDIDSLKLNEEKNEEEVLKIAALLTGYYATKARGKKIKLLITNI